MKTVFGHLNARSMHGGANAIVVMELPGQPFVPLQLRYEVSADLYDVLYRRLKFRAHRVNRSLNVFLKLTQLQVPRFDWIAIRLSEVSLF